MEQCIAALRRWGIRNLGALAALPRAQVHERLGELGVSWQRLAAGEDEAPLVPWLAEPVFEETLDLEWPVEGFEPLSFVLARLFEPLAARLELADRGAVAIRTALHLTTRAVHLRVLPLPAPMRDPRTLRTLVLLDLESHPAEAPIDRVQVRLEPTPGRVLQWTLFERAQPATEQVATLVARLTALVGDSHVGAPALVDSWKPGAFAMGEFQAGKQVPVSPGVQAPAGSRTLALGPVAPAGAPAGTHAGAQASPQAGTQDTTSHEPSGGIESGAVIDGLAGPAPDRPRTRPWRSGGSVCPSRSGSASTKGVRRVSPPIGMALAGASSCRRPGPGAPRASGGPPTRLASRASGGDLRPGIATSGTSPWRTARSIGCSSSGRWGSGSSKA